MRRKEQDREEDSRGQPPSYTASHGVRSNESKDKGPEAKDGWDNLGKAG